MHVAEFLKAPTGTFARVDQSGEPVEITRYNHDYVAIVPTSTWREAEKALAAMRGLRRLAEADSGELRAFAMFALGQSPTSDADDHEGVASVA